MSIHFYIQKLSITIKEMTNLKFGIGVMGASWTFYTWNRRVKTIEKNHLDLDLEKHHLDQDLEKRRLEHQLEIKKTRCDVEDNKIPTNVIKNQLIK